MSDSKRLSADAFLLLFAGLAGAACEKSAPPVSAEKPATQGSSVEAKSEPKIEAKEVEAPSAAPSGASKGCAPGGCAPGKCAGAGGQQ